MADVSDMELLRDYNRQGSEDAFAELVQRHVNLVYSVALRYAGIAAHAEEITQAVFSILAHKAADLRPDTILEGWLHETTRLTALQFMRGERRRQFREQEAYMQSTLQESTDASVWKQLAPLLDNALSRLGQKDRDAVMLRFFKEKSFSDVAAALQITEAAAQSRVHRAVEKLRRYFTKHGVVHSSAVLTATISAHSVQTAPAALAKAVTTVALAKGATASSSTLTLIKGALKIMAWTKLKTTVVVGAIALLAVGTTTVTVKEIAHRHEDAVWSKITRVDSRQLDAAPPTVSIRPAPITLNLFREGAVWSGNGKRLGLSVSVARILSDTYDISEVRIADAAVLPKGKYDFIVSLPSQQSKAMRAEIKKKLGLVAKRETRETEVLLLKVARPNAPGLKPGSVPDPTKGSSWRTGAGRFTCNNQTISPLASFLEDHLRTPVIDQTDLAGHYDIDLKWSESGVFQHPNLDALKQALLDQLGLELTPATQPIEMLVVEKAK